MEGKGDNIRLAKCTQDTEWCFAKKLRQKYFFEPLSIKDPYTWTFDNHEHAHFVLYQRDTMVGYAHIQLWPNHRAALRIIVIDEFYRNRGLGSQFLHLCEQWLEKQGIESLHDEARQEAVNFYRKNGFVEMPFNDPSGEPPSVQDLAMGKILKAPESIQKVVIRNLEREDLNKLARTFTFPWSTFEATVKLWEQWFGEQQEGTRTVCIIEGRSQFLGYGSLLRASEYPFFRKNDIPEVNAIWIDEPFRRQGLGRKLIEHLEDMALHEGYQTIGIGAGLYKDYGPAQKLYFKMGYQPDGNGITYKGNWVTPGAQHPIDDDLLIWYTKPLLYP
jgi:GNAT superfamily N-acetyltransferase